MSPRNLCAHGLPTFNRKAINRITPASGRSFVLKASARIKLDRTASPNNGNAAGVLRTHSRMAMVVMVVLFSLNLGVFGPHHCGLDGDRQAEGERLADVIIGGYADASRSVLDQAHDRALQLIALSPDEARRHRILAPAKPYRMRHSTAVSTPLAASSLAFGTVSVRSSGHGRIMDEWVYRSLQ